MSLSKQLENQIKQTKDNEDRFLDVLALTKSQALADTNLLASVLDARSEAESEKEPSESRTLLAQEMERDFFAAFKDDVAGAHLAAELAVPSRTVCEDALLDVNNASWVTERLASIFDNRTTVFESVAVAAVEEKQRYAAELRRLIEELRVAREKEAAFLANETTAQKQMADLREKVRELEKECRVGREKLRMRGYKMEKLFEENKELQTKLAKSRRKESKLVPPIESQNANNNKIELMVAVARLTRELTKSVQTIVQKKCRLDKQLRADDRRVFFAECEYAGHVLKVGDTYKDKTFESLYLDLIDFNVYVTFVLDPYPVLLRELDL